MKVKTFCLGLANGYSDIFTELDERVKKLGDIKIISLVDTFYPKTKETASNMQDCHMVRVVVYEELIFFSFIFWPKAERRTYCYQQHYIIL